MSHSCTGYSTDRCLILPKKVTWKTVCNLKGKNISVHVVGISIAHCATFCPFKISWWVVIGFKIKTEIDLCDAVQRIPTGHYYWSGICSLRALQQNRPYKDFASDTLYDKRVCAQCTCIDTSSSTWMQLRLVVPTAVHVCRHQKWSNCQLGGQRNISPVWCVCTRAANKQHQWSELT